MPARSIRARTEINGRSRSAYRSQSPSARTLGARIASIRQVASASSPAYSATFGDVDLVHPALVLPLADQVGDRDHRVAEQPLRELVEVVVALAALEQVAEDHRVGDRPGQLDARAGRGPACRT